MVASAGAHTTPRYSFGVRWRSTAAIASAAFGGRAGFIRARKLWPLETTSAPIYLDVELTHLPADNLDVGVEPSPKLFGHGERPVAIAEADGAIPDRDIHG